MEDLLKEKLARIKLMIFDVDGVLTDGRIIYNSEGVETKCFDVRDGHGIKLLMRSGIDVALVTARSSAVVTKRAEDIGIKMVFQGCKDKLAALEEIVKVTGLAVGELAYLGDDLIDLPVLTRVGFSVAVRDAVEELKSVVDYITEKPGGRGAAREVCELILKNTGKWDEVTARYYR